MDLGVTSGSMQKGYVQKLMKMEDRDTKEVERLGNRRTTHEYHHLQCKRVRERDQVASN